MKIFTCLVLLFVSVFQIQSQTMWTIKKDNSQKWYLQFDDEFNANELDQKNWRNGYPWGNVIMNLDLIYL